MGEEVKAEDQAVKATAEQSMSRAVRDLRDAGNVHVTKGAWLRAINCYTKAIELDDTLAVLYSNRAAAYFMNRNYEEALADSTKAVELDDKWWKGYKWKGLALVNLNRFEDAVDTFEAALKGAPDNVELQQGLEKAKAALEQAQNLYILPGPEMMQKLDGIPVFIVTDDKGQPFFITYEDGQQVCTFYFQYSDAVSTLDWIKKENPNLGKTAVVVAISLSQAFQLAQDTQQQYQKEQEQEAERKIAEGEKAGDDADANKEPTEGGETEAATDETKDATAEDKPNGNDELDSEVPLAFQFRPELRQVEAAVELHHNPELKKVIKPAEQKDDKLEAAKETDQAAESEAPAEEPAADADKPAEAPAETADADKADESAPAATAAESEDKKPEDAAAGAETAGAEDGAKAEATAPAAAGEEDEEELTVDNYNGIPIFQARGLTLSHNGKHFIPLFFSKWDLEDAWHQLNKSAAPDVPNETEIDVGTLEDVLRRMVEGDSKEFENVIFVPTSESLKNVGREFPLDELTNAAFGRIPAKKNNFLEAKKIAALGGSREAVREAIQKELMQLLDKNVYADQLDRISKSTTPRIAGARPTVNKPVTSNMAVKPKAKKGRRLGSATRGETVAAPSETVATPAETIATPAASQTTPTES